MNGTSEATRSAKDEVKRVYSSPLRADTWRDKERMGGGRKTERKIGRRRRRVSRGGASFGDAERYRANYRSTYGFSSPLPRNLSARNLLISNNLEKHIRARLVSRISMIQNWLRTRDHDSRRLSGFHNVSTTVHRLYYKVRHPIAMDHAAP